VCCAVCTALDFVDFVCLRKLRALALLNLEPNMGCNPFSGFRHTQRYTSYGICQVAHARCLLMFY
jgi:hypothetical protein